MRPKGYLTVSSVTDGEGKEIPLSKAVDYGWITPVCRTPGGWGIKKPEVAIGQNLFLDNGRQLMAYCMGFRAPAEDYSLQNFGVGTGTTAAKVTDVALEAPATLLSVNSIYAPIDSVDYLSAFVLRVSMTLALGDANGLNITELGLYSGNGTLFARKVRSVGINKTSDFQPVLCWRCRF